MRIVQGTTQFHIEVPTAVAIGKFDGVHLGHRRLLQELMLAKKDGLTPCVFTFDPSPMLFFGDGNAKELSTREEKRQLFKEAGVEILIEFPLTAETAAILPEDFIKDILVDKLQAGLIAAGADLSFGDRGAGNFALLTALGDHYNYVAKMVHKESYEGQEISSSLIRSMVLEGRMEDAAACLEEPYSVRSEIAHGNEIGRTIGIPTINQIPEPTKLLPPYGVYYSNVEIEGKTYHGMTNIGVKPTVEAITGEVIKTPTVETYLYGYEGKELYGLTARVSLLTYRRKEQRFRDLEELTATMQQDITAGIAYHGLDL